MLNWNISIFQLLHKIQRKFVYFSHPKVYLQSIVHTIILEYVKLVMGMPIQKLGMPRSRLDWLSSRLIASKKVGQGQPKIRGTSWRRMSTDKSELPARIHSHFFIH